MFLGSCDSTVERQNGRQEQRFQRYSKHENELGDSVQNDPAIDKSCSNLQSKSNYPEKLKV